MPTGPRYFLTEEGQRTGPHSLAVLRQKAEIGIIKPDTSIAPESDPDDWSPLSDSSVLTEELFPARPHFTLGPRTVDTVNSPADFLPAPSVGDLLRGNLARQRASESELLTPQPPRSNRRLRDYLFTVAAGAAVSMIPWLFVQVTVGHIILTAAATVFVAVTAAWVFFVVMDRY